MTLSEQVLGLFLGFWQLQEMTQRQKFLAHLAARFPQLPVSTTEPLTAPHLLSDAIVRLPESVLKQAQAFVSAAFALRCSTVYQTILAEEWQAWNLPIPGNSGMLMSYDFHLTEDGRLKLIEINTNAAFLWLGIELLQARQLPLPVPDFGLPELLENFRTEHALAGHSNPVQSVAIVDDNPASQRLYLEFLVAQAQIQEFGLQCDIVDAKDLESKYDLIYNRSTDFFFQQGSSSGLRQGFEKNKFTVTPQPYEYFLLADKARLLQWQNADFLRRMGLTADQALDLVSHLSSASAVKTENADELWSQRKSLFFKPQKAFGSKQAYKGASISRKTFDQILDKDFLAQEYIVAPEIDVEVDQTLQKMKYDLRFYAYQNRVQMGMARIYQGQVTNLQTVGGGFAPVQFLKD